MKLTTSDKIFWTIARILDIVETSVRVLPLPILLFFCVRELAGQATAVDVAINFLAKMPSQLAWVLAASCGIWAYGERTTRQIKIAKMADHINELETRLDPNRSTSGLTKSGQTPKRNSKHRG